MNVINDLTAKLSGLVPGVSGLDLAILAGTALVWAFVMAATPNKLRIVAVLYGVVLAAILYTQHVELLPWPLAGGAVWALAMHLNPFKKTKKA